MRKEIKKTHKKFVKYMRSMNESIAKDDLWRGRFFMKEESFQWYRFEDGSGGELWIGFLLCDKKTGYYKRIFINFGIWTIPWNITLAMNTFIVEDLDVWHTEGWSVLHSDPVDYTKVKWKPERCIGERAI